MIYPEFTRYNDDNLMTCVSKIKIVRGVPGEPIYKWPIIFHGLNLNHIDL